MFVLCAKGSINLVGVLLFVLWLAVSLVSTMSSAMGVGWTVFCGGGNAQLLGISSDLCSNSACRCVGLYPASAVVWELENSSVFWYSSCPLAFSWSRAAGACDKGDKP